MFKFEPRDEGLYATHDNGRGVAHIITKTISETSDPNLRVQKKVETLLSYEKWQIHFTGYCMTTAEMTVFLKELAGLY